MTLPMVKAETIESIIEEVCTKNTEFGIKDFQSKLDTENFELACVLYSFLVFYCQRAMYDDEVSRDEVCALT